MANSIRKTNIRDMVIGARNQQLTVRVISKWKRPNYFDPSDFYGLELILLDAEGDYIQMTANKQLMLRFGRGISEGHMYRITRFTVAPNYGKERVTPNECRLYFEFSTDVIKMLNVDIPKLKFNFVSFPDIYNSTSQNKHYIDVIGELSEYHVAKPTRTGSKWTIIELEDKEGGKLICSLWGSYVDEMESIVNEYKNGARPVLALQFVKRDNWKCETRITTTRGATKIYVNPPIPDVVEFRSRKADTDDHSQSSRITEVQAVRKDILAGGNIKSLQDLNTINQGGDYVTVVTIVEIDSKFRWYYDSCKLCRTKAKQSGDNLWYCNKPDCSGFTNGMKLSIPRFLVKFFVTGGQDVFGELMMFDNHINALVPMSAATLLKNNEKRGDGDTIPIELNPFIDQELVAKVRVSREHNIENRIMCYTVMMISLDKEDVAKWKALEIASKVKGKVVESSGDAEFFNDENIDDDIDDQDENNGATEEDTPTSLSTIRKRLFIDIDSEDSPEDHESTSKICYNPEGEKIAYTVEH